MYIAVLIIAVDDSDDIPGQSTSIVHNNDNWLEQVPTNTETKDPVKRKRPPAPTSLSSSRSMSVQAKARRVDNLSRPIVKPDASPSKDMAERDEKQACSNSTNMSQKRENDTVETSRGDAMQSARTGLTESKRDDDQQTSDNSSPKRVALKSSSMLVSTTTYSPAVPVTHVRAAGRFEGAREAPVRRSTWIR